MIVHTPNRTCPTTRVVGKSTLGDDFMKALQRDEALKVVPLAPPEPANDTKPIPAQPKKWRRVTINRKTLACALIAELIIVGAILVVNWSLAERGDTGEPVLFGKSAFWLAAMAGALAMATCELVRAGLVYLGAVHRRRAVRGLMLFGALLSVLVTTKSMSIVYEQLFASRLREVVAATMALDKARAGKATLEAKRKGPAADDAERKARLARFDAELAGLRDTLKQFGTPPKPVTKSVPTYDRHGRIRPPPRYDDASMVRRDHAVAIRQGSGRARQAGFGACAWPVRSSRPRHPDRAGGRDREGSNRPPDGSDRGEPDAFLRRDDLSQVAP